MVFITFCELVFDLVAVGTLITYALTLSTRDAVALAVFCGLFVMKAVFRLLDNFAS